GRAGLVQLPHLDAEADEEALGRADEGALVLALEQDVAGVEVAQPDTPLALGPVGQDEARALVEIEPDALRPRLGGRAGRGRVGLFLVGLGLGGGGSTSAGMADGS